MEPSPTYFFAREDERIAHALGYIYLPAFFLHGHFFHALFAPRRVSVQNHLKKSTCSNLFIRAFYYRNWDACKKSNLRRKIRYISIEHMDYHEDCVFCKIAGGVEPCHKIWEDEAHLAFLSIFPNTEGFSVVIPKKHYPSYVFDLEDGVYQGLMLAAKTVAHLLDDNLDDVGRCGLILEGFGIDHAHAKLFPMHGTKSLAKWKPITAHVDKYFDKYDGYISSHDFVRAEDKDLEKLARKIRKSLKFIFFLLSLHRMAL